MRHWLPWLVYAASAIFAVAGLRAFWLVAQTPTPEAEPGEVRYHYQVGEATPRGDRLRLTSVALLLLAAALAVIARELT